MNQQQQEAIKTIFQQVENEGVVFVGSEVYRRATQAIPGVSEDEVWHIVYEMAHRI